MRLPTFHSTLPRRWALSMYLSSPLCSNLVRSFDSTSGSITEESFSSKHNEQQRRTQSVSSERLSRELMASTMPTRSSDPGRLPARARPPPAPDHRVFVGEELVSPVLLPSSGEKDMVWMSAVSRLQCDGVITCKASQEETSAPWSQHCRRRPGRRWSRYPVCSQHLTDDGRTWPSEYHGVARQGPA